jgi:hypothetical protein
MVYYYRQLIEIVQAAILLIGKIGGHIYQPVDEVPHRQQSRAAHR